MPHRSVPERKEDGIETDLLKSKDGNPAEGQVHNPVLPVTLPTHPKSEPVKGATFEAFREKLTDRNATCLEGELIHPPPRPPRGELANPELDGPPAQILLQEERGCIASTRDEEIRLFKSSFHHPRHQQHGYFGGLLLFKATYLVMSPSRAPSRRRRLPRAGVQANISAPRETGLESSLLQ